MNYLKKVAILSAAFGALTLFGPRPAAAIDLASLQAPEFLPAQSTSQEAQPQRPAPAWDGFQNWFREHSPEKSPWMICDKYGYRCDPNPAYYGRWAAQYQEFPYSYYQNGYSNMPVGSLYEKSTDYSFSNVPLMGQL